ncbi:hypothetical protein BJF85_09490 [Saccharomonospora sp. CUA-673]|uniref:glycosyltransferase 87 family protein n=1 Tax=Saccharomonospora sp. CUA-673 TaxID=1904969 RepID=UPI0009669445|nr:glycosyltransferase 87 family protein [Saccharomonospora sp. CUA-673]OLT38530.1 hypothetical protein BJF85_09490 [Saccharomonospora sp. CUA-673]
MGSRLVPEWVRASWAEGPPGRPPYRPVRLDLVLYAVCTAYAVALALTDKHYGFRVWAVFAAVAYGAALAHSIGLAISEHLAARAERPPRGARLRSRWIGVAIVGVVGMLAPLVALLARRLSGGDWSPDPNRWAAQPEVWVIERSAGLLTSTGTPYVDVTALGRPPVVDDFTPYGPAMPVFGLPRAWFGGTPVGDLLTDARLMFALTAVLCAWGAWRLLGRPGIPVRAAQLAAVFPLTALTWATAGPDLAMTGLLILGCTLAAVDRPLWAALVLALATSAKLTVLPAAVVVGVLVCARLGAGALARFTGAFVGTCGLVNVPVLLVHPAAFVEHVLKFPTGLGAVTSPAASPLPGHLIASTGEAGRIVAFVLLGLAGAAVLWWLLRRPPVDGADAMLRIAVGLGAFTLLTPATRFGYLVYPVVLLGAMLVLRRSLHHGPPRTRSTGTSAPEDGARRSRSTSS